MSGCLWADIDAYLVAAVTADMGSGSAVTTHKIMDVVVGDELDFDAADLHLPAVLITSVDADTDAGPHGDGTVHADNTYRYVIGAVASLTTASNAKIAAQELGRRLRAMLASRHRLGGLTSTDGETVSRTTINRTELQVRGPVKNRYLGLTAVDFTVETEF